MTKTGTPPNIDEFELTLLGPGYGESIVLHIGGGEWILVDSCLGQDGESQALRYLEDISIDPTEAVKLIVATHWHDDHIRGIARLVEVCNKATFCCSIVFRDKEFLTLIGALEYRHMSTAGSGLREIYNVFSQFSQAKSKPTLALADRLIYSQGGCEIWSLSPNDANFFDFLKNVHELLPKEGESKRRIPSISPNDVAVALWIRVGDVTVLLGSDLEKRGWVEILQNPIQPPGKASVFKVPHHGSENAHEPDVWKRMLEPNPFAVLTPWRKGNRSLPSKNDTQRILSCTKKAYATASIGPSASAPLRRTNMVDKSIRESGVKLRRLPMSPGGIRLRTKLGSQTQWNIEKFGSACHLKNIR